MSSIPSLLTSLGRGVLAVFVLLILLGGIVSLLDGGTVTASPIATLESGMRPETDALKVEDGVLFWDGTITYYQEHIRTKEREIEGYYVPLVSAKHAAELSDKGESATFSRVQAMVYVRKETAEREFPFLGTGEAFPAPGRHTIHGPWKQGTSLPLVLKDRVDELLPGLDLGPLMVIHHDAPDETVYGILGMIVLLACAIGGWRSLTTRHREARVAQRAYDEPPQEVALRKDEHAVMDIPFGNPEYDDAHAGWRPSIRQR